MSVGRLANESPGYGKLRDELRAAEIALKDQVKRVAELRRRLPTDTEVEDYALREGPADLGAGDEPQRTVRLSELFEKPELPLILVHFMFGEAQEDPCPMCTMWADGYDGVVPHLHQRANFGVVVAGNLGRIRAWGCQRGWRHVRLLSSAGTSLKRDLGMEHLDGRQEPGVSVFVRRDDGRVRHFYTGGASLGEGQWNGMDLLSPVWNFFDLTPEGRGDWMPSRKY